MNDRNQLSILWLKALSALDWKSFYETEAYLCSSKHAVLYHVINMKAFGKYKIYSAKLKAYIFFLINKWKLKYMQT